MITNFNTKIRSDPKIGKELSEDLELKVITHRNDFYNSIFNRYIEMCLYLIKYKNLPKTINYLKMENYLLQGDAVAIGKNTLGKDVILGTVNNLNTSNTNLNKYFKNNRLSKKDINFCINKKLQCDNYDEIIRDDDFMTGNFIVVTNKEISFVSDYDLIELYCDKLSEIESSRFSLILQSKAVTYFLAEKDDETINQIVSKFYNGSPVLKLSNTIDIENSMGIMQGAGLISSNLTCLKEEYNNQISELNNILGINSNGVIKSSGVSDEESKSNNEFTTANANIKLNTRQNIFDMYNKRFNLDIKVVYDNDVEVEKREV